MKDDRDAPETGDAAAADDGDAGEAERSVDEAWKRAAREEAQKLDEEARAAGGAGGAGGAGAAEIPDASFARLLSGFATQALMNLGAIQNPVSGERSVDLAAARYTIDLLGILEKKTKGNLDEEEEKYLGAMLYDLRMRFVDESKRASGESPAPADGADDGGPGILGADGRPVADA